MTGEVRANREAVLNLRIYDSTQHPVELEGVINTGFTEYLTLPFELTDSLDLTFDYATGMELADGSVIEMKVYSVQVEWTKPYGVGPRSGRDASHRDVAALWLPINDGCVGRRLRHD